MVLEALLLPLMMMIMMMTVEAERVLDKRSAVVDVADKLDC